MATAPGRYLNMFQSTHPQGVRHLESLCGICHNEVSIHAPAGGATPEITVKDVLMCVSIHAPAGGATPIAIIHRRGLCGFNPRTRRGCDGRILMAQPGPIRFNPRTRRGCDE